MSDLHTSSTPQHTDHRSNHADGHVDHTPTRRESSETKPSFKTSELIAYVVIVIAVLIAATVSDKDSTFGAEDAWKYVTALTIGYMVSRGLAKSGSRDFHDAEQNNNR